MKSKYLQLLKQFNITPNFWCSEEYFQKAGLEEKQDGNWVYIWDPDANITVLPPVNIHLGACPIRPEQDWTREFWADFVDYYPGPQYKSELMDLEYTYDPKSFLNMRGGRWAVFRKNHRKFAHRNPICIYIEPEQEHEVEILKLVKNWLGDREAHEIEIIIAYALEGENRRILIDVDDTIYGINVWDENWARINYRLCICRPGAYYISEYMRYLFYISTTIQDKNKLVNDGGVLDNLALKFFKDKMNPIMVREVKTWIKSA